MSLVRRDGCGDTVPCHHHVPLAVKLPALGTTVLPHRWWGTRVTQGLAVPLPACPLRPATVFSPGLSTPLSSYQGPAAGDGCRCHTGAFRESPCHGTVYAVSGWTLISLVLSPVELLCHLCPSPLACSPHLLAGSIFPMLIASHNDVTLMSPCYLGPGPFPGGHGPGPCRGCAQLVRAVSCCSLVPKSHCPSVLVQAPSVHFCRVTHATSGPASAQHCWLLPSLCISPHFSLGWELWVGLSITPLGSGGAASPPLKFWCSVAEHPSLPTSA